MKTESPGVQSATHDIAYSTSHLGHRITVLVEDIEATDGRGASVKAQSVATEIGLPPMRGRGNWSWFAMPPSGDADALLREAFDEIVTAAQLCDDRDTDDAQVRLGYAEDALLALMAERARARLQEVGHAR